MRQQVGTVQTIERSSLSTVIGLCRSESSNGALFTLISIRWLRTKLVAVVYTELTIAIVLTPQ